MVWRLFLVALLSALFSILRCAAERALSYTSVSALDLLPKPFRTKKRVYPKDELMPKIKQPRKDFFTLVRENNLESQHV